MTRPDETSASAQSLDLSQRIRLIRGHRVLVDSDLAALYGVPTFRFNEAVKRNAARFPADFAFRLSAEEHESLRSQIAILKTGRGQHRKYLPYVFTEHGSIMAATILNSQAAIEMSVHVVRAFVRLRQMLASNTELARRLQAVERSDAPAPGLSGRSDPIHDANCTIPQGTIRSLPLPTRRRDSTGKSPGVPYACDPPHRHGQTAGTATPRAAARGCDVG
jgi:ORF6N domain